MSLGEAVMERVELAQVTGQLRRELSAAMREGEEAGPNAKVRFWVLELGAEAAVSSQRITLTLDPRRRGVAGKPLMSGSEQAGER